MKNSIFIMCMFLYTYLVESKDIEFGWLNKQTRVFEKFNLSNQKISFYSIEGKFLREEVFSMERVNLNDIPEAENNQMNGFKVNSHINWFTLPGTGYVYEYDRLKHKFSRIDSTFYRGFNFQSFQFYHNGKLFSLGGTGFWNVHSNLVFFDPKNGEWELVKTKGELKPDNILFQYVGFNEKTNKIYLIELKEEYEENPTTLYRFFELDLTSFSWKFLGTLDLAYFQNYKIKSFQSSWLDGLFYFHDRSDFILLGDPVKNELYMYTGNKNVFFGDELANYSKNDTIYSILSDKTKGDISVRFDFITKKELYTSLKRINSFYGKPLLPWDTKDISLGFLSVMMLSGGFYIFKLRKRQRSTYKRQVVLSPEQSVWDLLPSSGKTILDYVLEHGCNYMFTTDEISIILGCDKKAFDTQRQYRSKFISNFNAFFEENFQISNAIYRISSEEDKRFVCYQISEEALSEYRNLLNGIN